MGISSDNRKYTIEPNQTYDQISRELKQRGIDPDKVYEANTDKIRTHRTNKSDLKGWIIAGDVLNIPADAFKELGSPDQIVQGVKVTAANPATEYMKSIQGEIDQLKAYDPKNDKLLQENLAILDSSAEKQLKDVNSSGVLSPEAKVQRRNEIASELAQNKSEMVSEFRSAAKKNLEDAHRELARFQTVHENWPSVEEKMSDDAKRVVNDVTRGLPGKEQVALKAIAAELVADGISLKQPVMGSNGRIHYVSAEMKEKQAYNDSEPRYQANLLLESLDYTARNKGQVSDELKTKMNEMYAKCKTLSDSEPALREKLVGAYQYAYGAKAAEMMPPELLGKVSTQSPATATTFDRSKVGVGTVLAPGVTSNPAMSGSSSSEVVKNGVKVMTTAAAATGVGLTKQSKQALQSEYTTEAVGDALLRNPEFEEALKNRGKTGQQYTEDMMNQLDAYLKSGKADLQSTGEPAPVSGESRFNDPEFKKQFYKAYMERFIELSNDENRTPGDPPKDVDIADVYITAITMTALEKAKNKKGGSDSDSSTTQTASAATGKEQSTSAATAVQSQPKSNGVVQSQSAATAAPSSGAFTSADRFTADLNAKFADAPQNGRALATELAKLGAQVEMAAYSGYARAGVTPSQAEYEAINKEIQRRQLLVAQRAVEFPKAQAEFNEHLNHEINQHVRQVNGLPPLPDLPKVQVQQSKATGVESQQSKPAVVTQQSEAKAVEAPATQATKPTAADAVNAAGPFENFKQINDHLYTKSTQRNFEQVRDFLEGRFTDALEKLPAEQQLAEANRLALQFMAQQNIALPTAKELRELKKKSS